MSHLDSDSGTVANSYQLKLAARAERLASRAERLKTFAGRAFAAATSSIAGIEPGQPILVDHYSGKRHRNALARHDRAMRKACALLDAAKGAADAAERVGSAGISADDPDALIRLHAKVDRLKAAQEHMKAVNAVIRKQAKKGADAQIAALIEFGLTHEQALTVVRPKFGGPGFAGYQLTNNNANIRRIEERIKSLEYVARRDLAPERWVIEGETCDVIADKADNRLRLLFSGKPSETVRALLKRNGWRWSPSAGAWQRHLHTARLKWLRAALKADLAPAAVADSAG